MSKSTREFFDVHAESFDSIYLNESRLSRWFNLAFRKAIYERFDVAMRESGDVTDKTVLDIGCGSGRYVVEYVKRGARQVVGVDLSSKMLDLARNLAIREGVQGRCEFLQGDFLELGFTHQFDVVLAMGVFDYVDNPQMFLRRMVNLSRGVVIAGFPGRSIFRMHFRCLRYRLRNCPVFFYSEPELHQIARGAGLDDYKLIFIPHSGTGFVLIGQVGRLHLLEKRPVDVPKWRTNPG